MAAKSTSKSRDRARSRREGRAKSARRVGAEGRVRAPPKMADMFTMPDPAQFAKYAKTLTPEQAFELYRANAKLALDVIDNAIESTAKVRKLQFEGEEQRALDAEEDRAQRRRGRRRAVADGGRARARRRKRSSSRCATGARCSS